MKKFALSLTARLVATVLVGFAAVEGWSTVAYLLGTPNDLAVLFGTLSLIVLTVTVPLSLFYIWRINESYSSESDSSDHRT